MYPHYFRTRGNALGRSPYLLETWFAQLSGHKRQFALRSVQNSGHNKILWILRNIADWGKVQINPQTIQ